MPRKIHGARRGRDGKPTLAYCRWRNMIGRCMHFKHPQYKDYGARGITVCDRWLNFNNFLEDMGEAPEIGLSLDRINNDLGYYPENCRWATKSEQVRNRRSSKLNLTQVAAIKILLKENVLNQRDIGKIFNVNPRTVNGINTGARWG